MVNPCGLISALLVAELFPPESFNMKFFSSIDWVARHMIETWALEGKKLLASMEIHWTHQINCMSIGMSMCGCYMILISVYMEGHGITTCVFIKIVT